MSSRGPRLVLIGKQGAGKGTQSVRVAESFGVMRLATGDLFRTAINEGTEIGVEAAAFINRGELVPDESVIDLVETHLVLEDRRERGFVLDGFPRTQVQAEVLDKFLGDFPLDVVVDLDVPTEIVLHRIAGRRVCEDCGANFHVDNPPKKNAFCDLCGGEVVQRADDTEDSVMRRLELYEIETLPVIQHYRRSGALRRVDGSQESDKVFSDLLDLVKSRFNARDH
jgi:adenylate kinase